MSYSKIEQIAKPLKEEEKSFTDFKTIEERTEALGFPTLEQPLRFYTSEEVFPSRKQTAKNPVYKKYGFLTPPLSAHITNTSLNGS